MHPNSHKKKVLYIITKSNFGGAQRYVYDLATNIDPEAYTPVVALGGTGEKNAPHGTLQHKLEEKGVRVVPVTHFMRDMSFLNDIQVFFELLQIVRKEKPDVLHGTSSKAGGLSMVVGRLCRVPTLIFTSHGLAYDEMWRPAWQRFFITLFSWLTFFLSTKTIQITHDTYTRASRLPYMSKKTVLVHNGRSEPKFLSKKDARLKLCHGETVCSEQWVGTIAELTKNKNLDVLFEAVSLVHKAGIRPHIWILGEGEERDNLEKLAKSLSLEHFVHMPGYIHNASNYLSAFDIFTLPSRKEGLPYVLLEAGLAALPVVVSALPSIEDIVQHKKTGLMLPAEPQAFSEALISLLTDKNTALQYGEALHKHVTENFSVVHMVSQTSALYQPRTYANG